MLRETKSMFQVFQMFHLDVASVSRGCCKNRSGCCSGCTRMLQAFVPNVAAVFSRRMLQVCLFECCICFIHMLKAFYLDVVYVLYGFRVFLGAFCRCNLQNHFQIFG